jgi:para-nitrobenzyl esterase
LPNGFNGDNAPHLFPPPGALPPVATHSSEYQYLFDLPNAPFPGDAQCRPAGPRYQHAHGLGELRGQQRPSSAELPWPTFDEGENVMSLVSPLLQINTEFALRRHCAFWGAPQ